MPATHKDRAEPRGGTKSNGVSEALVGTRASQSHSRLVRGASRHSSLERGTTAVATAMCEQRRAKAEFQRRVRRRSRPDRRGRQDEDRLVVQWSLQEPDGPEGRAALLSSLRSLDAPPGDLRRHDSAPGDLGGQEGTRQELRRAREERKARDRQRKERPRPPPPPRQIEQSRPGQSEEQRSAAQQSEATPSETEQSRAEQSVCVCVVRVTSAQIDARRLAHVQLCWLTTMCCRILCHVETSSRRPPSYSRYVGQRRRTSEVSNAFSSDMISMICAQVPHASLQHPLAPRLKLRCRRKQSGCLPGPPSARRRKGWFSSHDVDF